jgi:hypothetical protein
MQLLFFIGHDQRANIVKTHVRKENKLRISNISNYFTLNDERSWVDLCIQLRNQQPCTPDTRHGQGLDAHLRRLMVNSSQSSVFGLILRPLIIFRGLNHPPRKSTCSNIHDLPRVIRVGPNSKRVGCLHTSLGHVIDGYISRENQ